jgi:Sortilin, neurotensin receptor 3, C-terminal
MLLCSLISHPPDHGNVERTISRSGMRGLRRLNVSWATRYVLYFTWHATTRMTCLSILTATLQQWYKRRKPDVDCYVGHKFEDPVEHDENCPCQDSDYEWSVTLSHIFFWWHSLRAGTCIAITTLSATTTNVYLLVPSPSRRVCARAILTRRIWVLQAIGSSPATLAIRLME